MKESKDIGKKGEELAAAYLVKQGYQILERNWYDRHRELDLVTRKDGKLVFVEVKTRQADSPELPFDAITRKKQRLLEEAAHAYIEQHPVDGEVRFDVIAVILHPDRYEIDHIEDAIYPGITP